MGWNTVSHGQQPDAHALIADEAAQAARPVGTLRAGNVALAVVFVDPGVLQWNGIHRRQRIAMKHHRGPAMSQGDEQVGEALMPEFIGDHDPANRYRGRGQRHHIRRAGPVRAAIRDRGGQVDAVQDPTAVGVLRAEGQQAEHPHESKLSRRLVLRLDADIVSARGGVAEHEHLRSAAAKRFVGSGNGGRVQGGQRRVGGHIQVNVCAKPRSAGEVGHVDIHGGHR